MTNKKECFPLKKDGTIDTCEVMKENEKLKKKVFIQDEIIIGEQTENEKLKDLLNRSNVRLAEEQIKNEELKKENDILVEGLGCKTCSIHLEYEVEELKAQIEKMKSCKNCKHYGNYNDDIMCTLVGKKLHCKNKDKWELAE